MPASTTIRSILLQKGSTVHSVAPDTTVFDTLKLMADVNVGALIVLEAGKLVGIVSERDYARKIVLSGRSSLDTPVRAIMSTSVVCTTQESTVQDCMTIMTGRGIRHLPVLDDKKIVGIVSIGDMVKTIIKDQEFLIEQMEHYIQGT